MNAVPPTFTPAGPADTGFSPDATSLHWAALADAAKLVATLAGVEPAAASSEMENVSELMREADAWRRERAERGIADLAAIMEPGIVALLAVNARGANPQPAAQALWREFVAARDAVLALLAASGARLAERGA